MRDLFLRQPILSISYLFLAFMGYLFIFYAKSSFMTYLGLLTLSLILLEKHLKLPSRQIKSFPLLLGGFFIYYFLGALWSLDPTATVIKGLELLLLAGITYFLLTSSLPRYHPQLFQVFYLGPLLSLCFFHAALDLAGHPLLSELRLPFKPLKPSVELLGLLMLPIILWISRLHKKVFYLAFLLMGSLLAFHSAKTLLFCYLLAAFLLWVPLHSIKVMRGMLLIFPLLAGLMTWITPFIFPLLKNSFLGSLYHRLDIWTYTWGFIKEGLWLGYGGDTSRALGEVSPYTFFGTPSLPLHPHNFYLQMLLELGVVGCFFIWVGFYQATIVSLKYAPPQIVTAFMMFLLCAASATHSLGHTWFLAAIVCASWIFKQLHQAPFVPMTEPPATYLNQPSS
jgi:O-antigen ligase